MAASGFTTDMPVIDSFAAVHGDFNVPTVWPAQIWETPGQEWLVAPRVGLGGDVAGGCPQVGVKCGVTDTTGNYDLQWDYRPWFEWYPYPAVYLTSAGVSTVTPGGDAARERQLTRISGRGQCSVQQLPGVDESRQPDHAWQQQRRGPRKSRQERRRKPRDSHPEHLRGHPCFNWA